MDTPPECPLSNLESIIRNSVQFTRCDGAVKLGASKVGGRPHLPKNFRWPYFKGENYDGEVAKRPLSFIAQFNLAEIAEYDKDGVLPHSGMLYFFYELETMCWGYDPDDDGCARVYYSDAEPDELSVTEFPFDLGGDKAIPEAAVDFSAVKNLPSFEEYYSAYGGDIDFKEYEAAAESLGIDTERDGSAVFKLLGYADLMQGSIIEECEMVSEGIYCGKPAKLNEKKLKSIKEKSRDWVLLAQFGTLSDDVMFGDSGAIYYYIRRQDLERRDFDSIHLSLQCC